MLAPHFPGVQAWSELLGVAFAGRSFSDIERDLSFLRRTAVLEDITLEEQFGRLLSNGSVGKRRRIQVASAIVEQGLASQRKARELTGVSRDAIRRRTTPKKKKAVKRRPKRKVTS
jgi:hypothetical protein